MKQVLCARCKKRPAMFFVTKVEGDKTTQEGLCIKCALEMNIGPVKQIMQSMGISEDELDDVSEQFEAMFGEDGGFEPGGAGTMPFLQNFAAMNGDNSAPQTSEEEAAPEKKKRWGKKNKDKGERKRKFLDQYCTDLTAKARAGRIDRIIGRDNEIYRAIQILCRRTKTTRALSVSRASARLPLPRGLPCV